MTLLKASESKVPNGRGWSGICNIVPRRVRHSQHVRLTHEKSYSPTTVLTYISAVGYVHRLAGCSDPSKSDRVQLSLRGYSKIRPACADTRLPITFTLTALELTQPSRFQRTLAQAMCSLAFFAALREGEITVRPGQAQSKFSSNLPRGLSRPTKLGTRRH